MGFALRVLAPEKVLLETDAQALVLRSAEGDMTVLDGHTSLVAAVVPGVVRVEPTEGTPLRLAVHGGFLQVDTVPGGAGPSGLATTVTLLVGVAELADEIDVERARRAREVAESALQAARERSGGAETAAPGAEEQEAAEALARADLRLLAAGEAPAEAVR